MTLPPELQTLKEEAEIVSCLSWALFKNWTLGPGTDRAGPCPICGGTDRFAIHTGKNTFNCRRCGLSGHGIIDLVMKTENVRFVRACELITGRKVADPISAEESARIHQEAAKRERERAADAERRRLRRRAEAEQIRRRSSAPRRRGDGGVVDYLDLRGLDFKRMELLHLREISDHPYVVETKGEDGRMIYPTIHRGYAMIGIIELPGGIFGGVHQTWIDVDQPSGKVKLFHPSQREKDGSPKALPAKKVHGSQKSGCIPLYMPPRAPASRIVMGEGIETTLTMLRHNFEPCTAYWAGINLGNMAGKAKIGFDNRRQEDEPDLDDCECFVPPDWCEELVFLCDSDEPETKTVEKLTRGLKRALAARDARREQDPSIPLLEVNFVNPIGSGKDLNDLVRVNL